jgi:uncharacterized membrane protein
LPSGATAAEFKTMSRDGKRLAGNISKNRTNYPALFALDGTVTALESYSQPGWIVASSSDGSIVLGGLNCTNPPTCSDTTQAVTTWTGTGAPKVVNVGTGRAISSSGTAVAGDFYDAGFSQNRGFIRNGNSGTTIPDLSSVVGMTPDGKYVAGALQSGGAQAGLWSAQTQTVTKIGSSSWSSTYLYAVNGTDPAVVGYGYISATDSYAGFRWKGGTITELGLLAGGKYTTPSAVALDGSTVVGLTGTNSFQQAFIWTDKDKLRTIVDELRSRGLEPAVDLKLTNLMFLSDDGKTIVGTELTSPPSFWRVVLK